MHREGDHNFWWSWVCIHGYECDSYGHEQVHSGRVGVVGMRANLVLRASSCSCDAPDDKHRRKTSCPADAFCSQERDEQGR
jgi:hypothetical protein